MYLEAFVHLYYKIFSIHMKTGMYLNICAFLCRTVSVGRGSSSPMKGAKLPDIVDTEPWDGKDGEVNIYIPLIINFS